MDARSGSAGNELEIIRSGFAALSALVVAQIDRALAAWQEGWDVSERMVADHRLVEERCDALQELILDANIRRAGTLFLEDRRFLDAVLVCAVAVGRTGNLAVEIDRHASEARAEGGGGLAISPSPEEVAQLALDAFQMGCAAFVRRDPWLALDAVEASADATRAAQATQTALAEGGLPGSGARRARMLLVARCVERVAANATSISDRARGVLGVPDARD